MTKPQEPKVAKESTKDHSMRVVCPKCKGAGFVRSQRCRECKGQGRIKVD